MLRMVSPEGPLFQHDKLACITAGRLPVLRDITDSSPELRELGRNIQPASAPRDIDMYLDCQVLIGWRSAMDP